jgi:hypothetical protein
MGLSLQILFCSTTEDKKTEPNSRLIYTYTEPIISNLQSNNNEKINPIIYSYPISNTI